MPAACITEFGGGLKPPIYPAADNIGSQLAGSCLLPELNSRSSWS